MVLNISIRTYSEISVGGILNGGIAKVKDFFKHYRYVSNGVAQGLKAVYSSSEQSRRYLRKFSKSSAIVPSITVCQQNLKFNGAILRSDAVKIPERGQAVEKKVF